MNMVIIIEVCHLSCKLINTSWIPALTRSPGSDDDDYRNASDDAVDGGTLPAIDDRLGGERHRRELIPGCNLEPAGQYFFKCPSSLYWRQGLQEVYCLFLQNWFLSRNCKEKLIVHRSARAESVP